MYEGMKPKDAALVRDNGACICGEFSGTDASGFRSRNPVGSGAANCLRDFSKPRRTKCGRSEILNAKADTNGKSDAGFRKGNEMIGIIGIVIFAMVFGGYILAGGKLAIILKSLPFENDDDRRRSGWCISCQQ